MQVCVRTYYPYNNAGIELGGVVNINNSGYYSSGIAIGDNLKGAEGTSLIVKGELNIQSSSLFAIWTHNQANIHFSSGSKTKLEATSMNIYLQQDSILDLENGAELNLQKSSLFAQVNSLIDIKGRLNIFDSSIILQSSKASDGPSKNQLVLRKGSEVFIRNVAEAIRVGFAANNAFYPNKMIIEEGANLAIKNGSNSVYKTAIQDYVYQNDSKTTNYLFNYAIYLANNVDFKTVSSWGEPDSNLIFDVNYSSHSGIKDYQNGKDYINNTNQYNNLLFQYNQLISDGGYKGINLLDGQKLKINFNEERSSKIEVNGVDASTKGLGISEIQWKSQSDVQKSLEELRNAVNQVRTISSQFGNYYSIVNSRQDFTDNLINVLTEGSDKLTLADMNEESANMLALQTRQQLAINSLSLASQASRSVLNLF